MPQEMQVCIQSLFRNCNNRLTLNHTVKISLVHEEISHTSHEDIPTDFVLWIMLKRHNRRKQLDGKSQPKFQERKKTGRYERKKVGGNCN